ncbi:MAG: hypothetical protein Q7L55_13295, partial [Actinomycetota bacterium]|nr:hypothetical protein [Actinomycetota bacterium]
MASDIDDGKHIRVFNYNATTTLINSTFDISLTPTPTDPGIEFNGFGNGAIERAFTLDLKVVDSANVAIAGASVVLKDTNGTTILSETTDANGLIGQQTVTTDVFKYSATNTGARTNFNTFSLTVTKSGKLDSSQTLDIAAAQNFSVVLAGECDADGNDFPYPMKVDTTTDKTTQDAIITVWGTEAGATNCGLSGTDTCTTAMGTTEANAITFEQIAEFAKAANGACAATNPAAGTFAVIGKLNIGSTTASTTFVKTTSESIDFARQLKLYASSTFISGQVSATGSPFGGSTISFSGTDATSINEGEFYILATSTAQPLVPGVPPATLKLFDSIVLHKAPSTTTPDAPRDLYWNGTVEARRTSFENWQAVRFLNATNTLVDVVFANQFRGFFPQANQGASTTFETIKSRRNIQGGLYASSSANFSITEFVASDIDDGKHIRVFNYNATTTLINSTFDISLTP